MKRLLVILVNLLIINSLILAQNVTVQGKVINRTSSTNKVWLRELVQKKDITSTQIGQDGSFKLQLTLQYPDFFGLMISQRKYVMLVLQPGDKVSVVLDAKHPANSVITGSSLTQVILDAQGIDKQINNELDLYRKQLKKKQQQEYAQLIEKNLGKVSSIIIAQQLPLDKFYDVHKKLAKSLEPFQQNPFVKQYVQSVLAYGKTMIGTLAPEIALPNPQGDTLRLSQTRGNYVLVDFWASWCRPCRAESPNLVRAYEKYHTKGFTIFSVSLDRNKQSWTAAIQSDGLGKWYHVSDLRGWQSQAARKYGVNSIPSNFLLDPQGRIIAKNLRGQALLSKLKEIYGQ